MNFDDGMKQNILFIVLIFVAFGIGYYVGCKVTADEWKAKIATAPSKRTVDTSETKTTPPAETKTIYTPPKPAPKDRVDVDSIFKSGITKGVDSIKTLFAYVTAPVDTIAGFLTGDTVRAQYDPLTRMMTLGLLAGPRIERTITIVDSVFVPMPSEQAWYDHWYVGTIGTIVLVFAASQL